MTTCDHSDGMTLKGEAICGQRTRYTGYVGLVAELCFPPRNPGQYRPVYALRSCPDGHITKGFVKR